MAFLDDLEDLRWTGDSSSDSVSSYRLGGLEGLLLGDFLDDKDFEDEAVLGGGEVICPRLREAKGTSSSSLEGLSFFLVARLTKGSSSSDSSLTTTREALEVAALRARGTSSSSLSSFLT